MFRGGARILVGGEGTSDKISYMKFPQVLYCNASPKFRFGERSAKMYSLIIIDFKKFLKNL